MVVAILSCFLGDLKYNCQLTECRDFLLTEMTLLFSLLPPLLPLVPSLSLSIASAPSPLVEFSVKFLLFRLMLGFGIEKFWFMDEETFNGMQKRVRGEVLIITSGVYIQKFLEWQPHPTPAAWYVSKLPQWIHMVSEIGLWCTYIGKCLCTCINVLPAVVEMVLPWMMIFCMGHKPTEIFIFFCLLGLQIGIQLCGNFGIFNMLSTVLAATLWAPSPTWQAILSDFYTHPILGSFLLIQVMHHHVAYTHQSGIERCVLFIAPTRAVWCIGGELVRMDIQRYCLLLLDEVLISLR